MVKTIQTKKAPAAIGAYSQAVEKGNLLFISGQLPINPETNEMSESIVEQAEQSLRNIQAILSASDMTLEHVVKNTIFVTSLEQAAAVNEVYAKFFRETQPARAMVGVKELPKNASIEIESIAMR
ncbi:Rid family detoxifying hydrolase [Halobacillus sp. A1]|uniref:Rid family detoxifying hydrolase n=1 Tax=Halobacillus sp. A1 TaxID=2880262 RepID=UPI0020A66CC5|nr:Rid family detoxifying hydrolase [Halobacillus sp. A1]MCP3032362.1 Rid family detoxifying hydrolase [Halobacillus sp. A1]